MNAYYSGELTPVQGGRRTVVQNVFGRSSEEFTVFRELVQNADDAGAANVEIEFQTGDYAAEPSRNWATYGTDPDLTCAKIFKWVVRNDGESFRAIDWDRLTNIGVGNPDDQKIGTFGVGFFSVFSVTDSPVIMSGDRCMKMYYKGDQLMVQPGMCEATKWTTIEMEVKHEQLSMPKPFDLSRFLCTAVTFLVRVQRIIVLFNGQLLSEIVKSPGVAQAVKLPKELKNQRDNGFMRVQSVRMIPQEVRVTLTDMVYSAESKSSPANKTLPRTNISIANYTIYSAQITSTPPKDIVRGLEEATKKPPTSFPYEAVHFSKDEYQRVMQEGNEEGSIGSVFRGVQALCSEGGEGHASRLFVGQRTAQTSGSAIHLSSRFIPTVERGSIDLVNGQIAKWNAELLYVGGLLTRLIYEQAMKDIRSRWPKSPSPTVDGLREEALYTMGCFTFRQSTPDSKVGELLQSAFFNCSTSLSFPILSNLGIRFSKDVRQPHAEFKPFMKECPILDKALWPIRSTMIEQLPEEYPVALYTFRDVKEELDKRIFTEEEMIACIGWWVRSFGTESKPMSDEDLITVWRDEFSSLAQFLPSKLPPRTITLSTIKKFVDTRQRSFFIQNDDPLPPDTISMSFTRSLDASQVMAALSWEPLTIVDWIQFLVSGHGLDPTQDICKSAAFSEKVFLTLRNLWSLIQPADRGKIVDLMQCVPCIPTNREHQKPHEAYFPQADLFNDLPVVLFGQPYTDYEIVLQALGVKRALEWNEVKDRLIFGAECSMMRLVAYLQAVRRWMDPEEFMTVKQLPIFACAAGEEEARYCIHEVYRPDPLHRALGLPVLIWDSGKTVDTFGLPEVGYDYLYEFGLQQYLPLNVIIEKACSEDATVRQHAYTFLVEHLEDHYKKYTPTDFSGSAFLPCGNGDEPEFGTPEEVFTSHEWEIFGFRTIHKSVPRNVWARLKVNERPSAATIIKTMREKSPPTVATAKMWFDLLAHRGGFSAEDLAVISEMALVPVQLQPDGTYQETVDPPAVPPNRCFYAPPDPTKAHHLAIFAYVNYNEPANSFLKMCGAKPSPDCSDIVAAMVENPQEYLNKIERFMDKRQLDKTHAYKRYLVDLSQVAAEYHSLSTELRTRMKKAPIFISFRKKRSVSHGPLSTESQEYALKPAREIFIDEDLENHQSFGEDFFVAPKGEVFEKFYCDHGSKSLSPQTQVQPPSQPSWLRDVLQSSAVAPLGETNDTSDPLGAKFFQDVVISTSDAPLQVDVVRKKRFAKFRVRSVFTQKRKDGGAETPVQRPPKRAFKFRTMLTRKKTDGTQPQPDHQQGAGGAEADIDAQPETTPRELTAKGKGKHKEPNSNSNIARHNGRASTRTAKHQPTTSASQTKHEVRDRVARVRQAITRRRDGSTAQAHRWENMTVGDGNSNERDVAGPSRVSSSNRRPWITLPRRIRNSEVVEIMEGQMPDRYVSGLKYAKKKRSSSLESGSRSGSGDTEDEAEDSVEGEPERRPRNTTPGGLIGVLCFCSCIP